MEASAQILEDQADRQRRKHRQRARQHHLLQGCAGHDANTAAIVRFGSARHDARILAELRPDIFNDVLRRAAYGLNREGGEEENQHRAQQSSDEYGNAGEIDIGEAPIAGKNLVGIREALRHDAVHRFQVGGKEQKGCQRGGTNRIAFGERLGRVASRVEFVGFFAHGIWLVRHFDNAAGIVGNGAKRIHGEDVCGRRQHAHGRNGCPINALGVVGDGGISQSTHPEVVAKQQSRADHDHRHGRCLHTNREPADDISCGPGERRIRDRLHRPVARLGVVLRNAHKKEGSHHADNAATQQPPAALQHVVHGPRKAGQGQQRGDVVAAIQCIHRVLIFPAMHHKNADEAGHQVDSVHDEGKQDAFDAEDGIKCGPENHGTDVFCGGGFEDVRSAAGTVAHVVAYQVCDDRGIAGIVFGNAGLDFAHQVSADVSRLGIDATAKLGEERDQ